MVLRLNRLGLALLGLALVAAPAPAVDTATFVFDTISDPGDLPDGPDYDATGVNPIDDTSTLCDAVVMVMVDPTGTPVDVDSFCLSIPAGTGGSDGDYGSFGTGYIPVASPVTYTLFDLTAADLAALAGYGDSDQEYFDYVVANARCLDEQTFDETDRGIPDAPPFLFCGSGPSVQEIPTLDDTGLALAAIAFAAMSLVILLRRRAA